VFERRSVLDECAYLPTTSLSLSGKVAFPTDNEELTLIGSAAFRPTDEQGDVRALAFRKVGRDVDGGRIRSRGIGLNLPIGLRLAGP
jgi:hypothetical protein